MMIIFILLHSSETAQVPRYYIMSSPSRPIGATLSSPDRKRSFDDTVSDKGRSVNRTVKRQAKDDVKL